MALESLGKLDTQFGWKNPSLGGPSLKFILKELQSLKVRVTGGIGGGASTALSGASEGRGDTILAAISIGTAGANVSNISLSSISFQNDRVKIIPTTTGRAVMIFWWQKNLA